MKYLLNGEKSERLEYRLLTEADFETWLPFFISPESVKYFGDVYKQEPALSCRAWFDKVLGRYENDTGGMMALTETESGKFVGQCGIMVQIIDGISEFEIGYSLLPEYCGKGFATEAARKCKDFAFAHNFTDRVISIIHPKNKASEKVAIANGMTIEKQSKFHGFDVNIWVASR